MESKLALEEKGRVAFLNDRRRQRHDCVDTRHAKPCSCSCSSLVPPQQQQQQGPKCKEKLIEFLCSCCLLCVCCPLAAVCCCIKMPCRICQKALRRVWQWACCGSRSRVFAEYSSFSDIDSDVTYGKVKPSTSSVSGDRRTERHHHLLCE